MLLCGCGWHVTTCPARWWRAGVRKAPKNGVEGPEGVCLDTRGMGCEKGRSHGRRRDVGRGATNGARKINTQLPAGTVSRSVSRLENGGLPRSSLSFPERQPPPTPPPPRLLCIENVLCFSNRLLAVCCVESYLTDTVLPVHSVVCARSAYWHHASPTAQSLSPSYLAWPISSLTGVVICGVRTHTPYSVVHTLLLCTRRNMRIAISQTCYDGCVEYPVWGLLWPVPECPSHVLGMFSSVGSQRSSQGGNGPGCWRAQRERQPTSSMRFDTGA